MAQFLKHVGKVGDRKVAVIFRQIPGEDHMCLVVYTELLNQNIHDPLIKCIESEPAQREENLAEALNKNYTRDGKIILQVLHVEGMMKKVQTSQVLMTPAPNQAIKLSELNNILNEMSKGEEAIKRMREIDNSRGLQDPKDIARRMNDAKKAQQTSPIVATTDDVFGDLELPRSRLQQSEKMAAEARGLLAESERLAQEAYGMDPSLNPVQPKVTRAKKPAVKKTSEVTTKQILESVAPKKSGRPRKTTVTG